MQPDNPVAELLKLLGAGRFTDAERQARRYLKQSPDSFVLNELLGIALSALRQHKAALPYLEKAARGDPSDAQFVENLGICHYELGNFSDAEVSLRKALALRPNSVEAINALGSLMRQFGRHAEACDLFERVLTIDPRHTGALFNLGKSRFEMGEWAAAENIFRRGIALPAKRAEFFVTLCELFVARGRGDEARSTAVSALERLGWPDVAVTRENIGLLDNLAAIFDKLGDIKLSLDIYRSTFASGHELKRALSSAYVARRASDWAFAAEAEKVALKLVDEAVSVEGIAPWMMLSVAKATPAQQMDLAKKSAERISSRSRPVVRKVRPRSGNRIKIGYFSGDFFDHPTAHLIAGVVEAHDRSRFEITAYDVSPEVDDQYRRRLQSGFEHFWKMRDYTDEQAAKKIAEDETDIILDLNGWTFGHRASVLAKRPAHLQVQWLGYAGTLGADWIDYIVADPTIVPQTDEIHYTERVIRLPWCYQPNDNKREISELTGRADNRLPDNAFVFCSFNQSYKITQQVFDVWIELLKAVPDSVLWLLQPNPVATKSLLDYAAGQGVAATRIVFAPIVANAAHRARLQLADLALDTFPYGSHTTGSDALYAGVPLVALKGDTFASRVSASILYAAGLEELITDSFENYRALAIHLATERGNLTALRRRIEASVRQHSPLFDTAQFTRDLENALTQALERHDLGLPPGPIDVAKTY